MDPAESYDTAFPGLCALATATAKRIVGNHEDAADIGVETLARAYQRWPRVSAYGEAWVVRVATNLALDQVRRQPPRQQPQPEEPDYASTVAASVDMAHALAGLSKRQRQVLSLWLLCDLSQGTIAEILGISIGSVKRHARRGAERLRAEHADDRLHAGE